MPGRSSVELRHRRPALLPHRLSRSQNLFEESFLRLCVDRLRAAAVSAVWLCDRGFHRAGRLKLVVECGQHFVVRLKRDVTVRLPAGACQFKSLAVAEGERRDFGFVELRQDGAVRVRLIGVWAEGAKEVRWLATDLENPVSKVVSYYDRRMGIEEQFRDEKGVRYRRRVDSYGTVETGPRPVTQPRASQQGRGADGRYGGESLPLASAPPHRGGLLLFEPVQVVKDLRALLLATQREPAVGIPGRQHPRRPIVKPQPLPVLEPLQEVGDVRQLPLVHGDVFSAAASPNGSIYYAATFLPPSNPPRSLFAGSRRGISFEYPLQLWIGRLLLESRVRRGNQPQMAEARSPLLVAAGRGQDGL